MQKTGFGVVGLGIWGETHVKTYAQHPQVELVKVCDVNRKRAKEVAAEYGAGGYCTDFMELVNDPNISAVSVVTPDFLHTKIATAAAKAGKHVLLEKPMATKVAECQKIIDAAKKAGVKLMVDFHNRWNPAVVKIKNAIDNGELGEVQMMYVRLNDTIAVPTEWLKWAGQSTVLWFLASHTTDMIRWLTGDEFKKVYSVSRSKVLKGKGVNTPDFFQSILELKKGAVVSLEHCWIVAESAPNIFDFKVEIVGSKGTMYVDASHNRLVEKYTAEEAGYADAFVMPTVHGKPVGFAVESIRHFVDCVLTDAELIATGEDGLAATKAVLALTESARTKKPVLL